MYPTKKTPAVCIIRSNLFNPALSEKIPTVIKPGKASRGVIGCDIIIVNSEISRKNLIHKDRVDIGTKPRTIRKSKKPKVCGEALIRR